MLKRHRKRKKSRKLYVLLLIVIITIFAAGWQYRISVYSPVDKNDDTNISIQIKKGEAIKEIAKNLEENDLIKSDFFFYLYTRFNDLDTEIIAGRFVLNKTMNTPQILETISDPSQAEFIITIQEGLTIKDIEEKLIDLGLIEKDEFISAVQNFNGWEYYDFISQTEVQNLTLPLEGLLYPDTYFLDSQTFEPDDLIYTAMDNFERKIGEIDKNNSKLDQYSLHEVLTMASIIENEVFGEEDRHIVSGILWKRLENGWHIGADATLLYITEDRTINSEDLEIDSPYNTRKNLGLPPGPISNPSVSSIKAALFPEESEYWFYLTTLDTGEVIYAKSNEEHNVNRVKYL